MSMAQGPRCGQPHFRSQGDGPPITLDEIRCRLRQSRLVSSPRGNRKSAAVALILREGDGGPDILFIERAKHDGDPWSGDLGFPGGKVETGDAGPRQAAERETFEEIGIDLRGAEYLGHLCNLTGDHLPIFVSCFAYLLPAASPIVLSREVNGIFWFPLQDLFDPARHSLTTVRFREEALVRPAINLLGPGRTVLWGITYRLITRFAEVLGRGCHLFPDRGRRPE